MWWDMSKICGLYKCQFPGYNIVLQLYKMSPMGEIGEEYIDLSVLFLTAIGEDDILIHGSI